MNSPLVSVIVVYLDEERFLDEAIRSVFAQTWPHWEMVLVDDGSTDGSARIAERYRAKHPDRIHCIAHAGGANRGISASRNAGVAAARGEYIAFLDGDDVYLPDRLQAHVDVLASHPDLPLLQSCVEYWRTWSGAPDAAADGIETAPLGDHRGIVAAPRLLRLLLETRGATAQAICSMTIRRDRYLALGGCEESFHDLFEDQVLCSKFYLDGPVFVMPDVLARYRRHDGSIVERAGEEGLRAARRGYLEWLERYAAALPRVSPSVTEAIGRALFEYRHPWLWSLRSAPGSSLRQVRRLGYALLPDVLADPIVTRWRAYKGRKTARLLERARQSIRASE